MLSLRDAAFEAGVEGIATEECHHFRLVCELGVVLVVLTEGFEAGYAADGVLRAGFDWRSYQYGVLWAAKRVTDCDRHHCSG